MGTPRISVFMPSFNKPGGYAVQAIESCLSQDFPGWELWVMENSTEQATRRYIRQNSPALIDPRIYYKEIDLTPEIRSKVDVPVWLCNAFYPRASGDFILYMSDDDYWLPGIFGRIVSAMDSNPDWEAMYFNAKLTSCRAPEDTDPPQPWIGATHVRGAGQVDSQIDGGQMTFRKSVLDRVNQPWFPEGRDPHAMTHSDGIFMEKLAQAGVLFHPVDFDGLVHRRTPVSTYTKA